MARQARDSSDSGIYHIIRLAEGQVPCSVWPSLYHTKRVRKSETLNPKSL